jgi:hypothetical protein
LLAKVLETGRTKTGRFPAETFLGHAGLANVDVGDQPC